MLKRTNKLIYMQKVTIFANGTVMFELKKFL